MLLSRAFRGYLVGKQLIGELIMFPKLDPYIQQHLMEFPLCKPPITVSLSYSPLSFPGLHIPLLALFNVLTCSSSSLIPALQRPISLPISQNS